MYKYLQMIHHYEDRQAKMNDVEAMTTAIVAALFFVVGLPMLDSCYTFQRC